jgi:hypothetical protein
MGTVYQFTGKSGKSVLVTNDMIFGWSFAVNDLVDWTSLEYSKDSAVHFIEVLEALTTEPNLRHEEGFAKAVAKLKEYSKELVTLEEQRLALVQLEKINQELTEKLAREKAAADALKFMPVTADYKEAMKDFWKGFSGTRTPEQAEGARVLYAFYLDYLFEIVSLPTENAKAVLRFSTLASEENIKQINELADELLPLIF